MRDPAASRTESPSPTVDRLVAGALDEGPRYRCWRTHGTTDWLLVHTLAGRGRFGLADGETLLAEPGSLVAVQPGTRHDYGTAPGAAHWSLQYAHVHPRPDWSVLLAGWPQAAAGVRHRRVHGEVGRRVADGFARAGAPSREALAHPTLFGLNALESALLWSATQGEAGPPLDPRLLAVLEDVDARLAEPLTVETLARRAGLSASRLSHLFRDGLGVPPMRYVERQRMQAARRLLELTSRPVAEVARSVGYPDPLYFSARFRHCVGCSPRAYRADLR